MYSKITFFIILFILIGFIFFIIKNTISYFFKNFSTSFIDKINMVLPQTQCRKCGYSGCLPYAEAIVQKKEKVNKCMPGGMYTEWRLSEILNIEYGFNQKINKEILKNKKVAWINEDFCIGCKKCSKICPVDAIIGAKNTIHTVLSDVCTGCELCISLCPTDCIQLFVSSK